MTGTLAYSERYDRGAIWFHWAIAVLVIVNLLIGLFHDSVLAGAKGAIPLHKSIGITVLALTLGRIGWRLTHAPPRLPATTARWEVGLAHATHFLLYALMLLLPLTGWMLSSGAATPRPISWFGVFAIPDLPVSRAVGGTAHEAHGLLGYVMAALVVLHIAAALRHRFLLRDAVLHRMFPGAR